MLWNYIPRFGIDFIPFIWIFSYECMYSDGITLEPGESDLVVFDTSDEDEEWESKVATGGIYKKKAKQSKQING